MTQPRKIDLILSAGQSQGGVASSQSFCTCASPVDWLRCTRGGYQPFQTILRHEGLLIRCLFLSLALMHLLPACTSIDGVSNHYDMANPGPEQPQVAYCQTPLKIPNGKAYDYQYLVYAKTAAPDPLNLDILKGLVVSLSPSDAAKIKDSKITVYNNASLILHTSSGERLNLTAAGNVQLAAYEACDEFAIGMLVLGMLSKQLALERNLFIGQVELAKAMAEAAKPSGGLISDGVDGGSSTKLPRIGLFTGAADAADLVYLCDLALKVSDIHYAILRNGDINVFFNANGTVLDNNTAAIVDNFIQESMTMDNAITDTTGSNITDGTSSLESAGFRALALIKTHLKTLISGLEAFKESPSSQSFIKNIAVPSGEVMSRVGPQLLSSIDSYLHDTDIRVEDAPMVQNAAKKLASTVERIEMAEDDFAFPKIIEALIAADNSNYKKEAEELQQLQKNQNPEAMARLGIIASQKKADIGLGGFSVFALGPLYETYGINRHDPRALAIGLGINKFGLLMFVASLGATYAKWQGIVLSSWILNSLVNFLAITVETVTTGGIIGLGVTNFIYVYWCWAVELERPGCYKYRQPLLAFTKASGTKKNIIEYEITGFDVEMGVGDQEGKSWMLTYQGSYGAQLGKGCVVTNGSCKGKFTLPSTGFNTIRIWAQDLNHQFQSTAIQYQLENVFE